MKYHFYTPSALRQKVKRKSKSLIIPNQTRVINSPLVNRRVDTPENWDYKDERVRNVNGDP